VFEIIVGWIIDDRADANWQGEETLCDSGIPDSGFPQGIPFWRYEKEDAIDSTLESNGSDQQSYHYDVRKYRKKIGSFARTLHATKEYSKNTGPTEE